MVETQPGKIHDCVLVFEAPELLGEQTADKLKFQGNLQGRRATTSVGQGAVPAAATFGPLIYPVAFLVDFF